MTLIPFSLKYLWNILPKALAATLCTTLFDSNYFVVYSIPITVMGLINADAASSKQRSSSSLIKLDHSVNEYYE